MKHVWTVLAVLVATSLPTPELNAQDAHPSVGPELSAASNLSQGRIPNLDAAIGTLGLDHLRDGLSWARAEPLQDTYDFTDMRTGYLRELDKIRFGVVLNWGNPLYDGGDTPYSAEALAAFGRFAARLVTDHPNIDALEIGNEINGVNFVKGPLREMAPLERARAYAAMLVAGATAAKIARPDIRILGGATHSLPGAFLQEVMANGGADVVDALAVHPYTSRAEELRKQVSVLRRYPSMLSIPLEVTEFGTENESEAAAHFVKQYCQMALSGVARVAWYPLNPRGDGLVPLVDADVNITEAGLSFQLIQARMEGRQVLDMRKDPFSYGCQFGDDTVVLWGEGHPLALGSDVRTLAPNGDEVPAPKQLNPDVPLIVVGHNVAKKIEIGPPSIIADSYHQFEYPADGASQDESDGFERFARVNGLEMPLYTLPGQEARGTPWFPYRGNAKIRPGRLTPRSMVLAWSKNAPVEIVHRFSAQSNGTVKLIASFEPGPRSTDGIVITVTNDTKIVFQTETTNETNIEVPGLILDTGDTIEVSVSPGKSSKGDVVGYRIKILQDD